MPQQFPIIESLRNHPLLTGLKSGMDLYKQAKMTPMELKQAQLANMMNEQKQQEHSMYLQKYPELLAAELSKAQLEPGEMKARTGLMGGQLQELQQRMKYNPQLFSAEAGERKAKSEKLNRENELIQRLLGGGNNVPRRTAMEPNQAFGQPGEIQRQLQSQGPAMQQGMEGMDYPQAALLSHITGLPKPEIREIDGQLIGITPFGNFNIAKGPSHLQKELSKEDAKKIGNLEEMAFSGITKQQTLDELSSVVSDPTFQQMRTIPIAGKYELAGYAKFGTPEQKDAVGRYYTLTGQIVKDSVRDFPGQFRIGEQGLLNSMKPNPSDTVEVAMGKIKSLSLMNRMLTERSRITSELMRNKGLTIIQASKEADKLINGEEIRKEIKQSLEPKYENKKSINGKNYVMKDGKVYEL